MSLLPGTPPGSHNEYKEKFSLVSRRKEGRGNHFEMCRPFCSALRRNCFVRPQPAGFLLAPTLTREREIPTST
jgi:hypothetical protein